MFSFTSQYRSLLLGTIFLVLVTGALSAKIVFFVQSSTKSHKNVHYPIARELIKRGHTVTMFSLHKPHEKIEGLIEHSLEDADKSFIRNFPILFDENGPNCTRRFLYYLSYHDPELCRHYLKSPQVQKLLKSGETYDLAIINAFMSECQLPLAKKVAKSIIYVTPGETLPQVSWSLNIPIPPYVPSVYFASTTTKMSFIDRIYNSAAIISWLLFREFRTIPEMDKVIQEVIPGAMSVKEAEQQIELVLVNRHHVIDYNIPSLPFVQEIGGITIQPAKPLPKDLEEFVRGSGQTGFVAVSFGTAVPDEKVPEAAKRAFLETFARIPQKVLWKFTLPIENLPPNVKQVEWLPQTDVLGHSKCVAFITHGGHFSLMETVYHGVPIVGFPVFADQPANLRRAQDKKFGIKLDWNDITADKIVEALNTVINDTSFKESLIWHQKLFKDQPMSPHEKAVYWIEHILRHGGRLHLRAEGADSMNFVQYFMLDIIGVFFLLLTIVVYITFKVTKLIFCGKSVKKTQKKQKTK